jgi:hypothetical protein
MSPIEPIKPKIMEFITVRGRFLRLSLSIDSGSEKSIPADKCKSYNLIRIEDFKLLFLIRVTNASSSSQ